MVPQLQVILPKNHQPNGAPVAPGFLRRPVDDLGGFVIDQIDIRGRSVDFGQEPHATVEHDPPKHSDYQVLHAVALNGRGFQQMLKLRWKFDRPRLAKGDAKQCLGRLANHGRKRSPLQVGVIDLLAGSGYVAVIPQTEGNLAQRWPGGRWFSVP